MKKYGIVKMVVSAAAAAYVAVMPVQAEEISEEIIIRECKDSCAGPYPDDQGQTAKGDGDNNCEANDDKKYDEVVNGNDMEDQAAYRPEGDPAFSEDAGIGEAEYSAMGQISGGEIEENGEEESYMEELIRKTGYGPHLLLYKKEEEKEAEPEPARPAYSEEDLYVLAHAICGEGQGYPDDEQLYIGSVILNRRAHGAFPDTIKGVVFQRGQYACTRDGNYYREPTEANWRNARWLLENGSVLPGNVVYQAGFRQGSGLYAQTRYHKYCYR